MSIPKTIHYCWFGRNPKPKLAEKCIKSWRKYCPDYEIIEWNEDNFDISAAPLYVRQAYDAKRWAFVTDYVRLKIVYDNGGIYLDTDVELKKNLDFLLKHGAYFGFEDQRNLNTGLGFGAEKGAQILLEMMEDYQNIPFLLEDGSCDLTPCPKRNTKVLLRHGLLLNNSKQQLEGDILILPTSYLCPIDYLTKKRNFTEDTVSIHWFDASWQTKEEYEQEKKYAREYLWYQRMEAVKRVVRRIIGDAKYQAIKKIVKGGCTEDGED